MREIDEDDLSEYIEHPIDKCNELIFHIRKDPETTHLFESIVLHHIIKYVNKIKKTIVLDIKKSTLQLFLFKELKDVDKYDLNQIYLELFESTRICYMDFQVASETIEKTQLLIADFVECQMICAYKCISLNIGEFDEFYKDHNISYYIHVLLCNQFLLNQYIKWVDEFNPWRVYPEKLSKYNYVHTETLNEFIDLLSNKNKLIDNHRQVTHLAKKELGLLPPRRVVVLPDE
jgi:hypothetical protein